MSFFVLHAPKPRISTWRGRLKDNHMTIYIAWVDRVRIRLEGITVFFERRKDCSLLRGHVQTVFDITGNDPAPLPAPVTRRRTHNSVIYLVLCNHWRLARSTAPQFPLRISIRGPRMLLFWSHPRGFRQKCICSTHDYRWHITRAKS